MMDSEKLIELVGDYTILRDQQDKNGDDNEKKGAAWVKTGSKLGESGKCNTYLYNTYIHTSMKEHFCSVLLDWQLSDCGFCH